MLKKVAFVLLLQMLIIHTVSASAGIDISVVDERGNQLVAHITITDNYGVNYLDTWANRATIYVPTEQERGYPYTLNIKIEKEGYFTTERKVYMGNEGKSLTVILYQGYLVEGNVYFEGEIGRVPLKNENILFRNGWTEYSVLTNDNGGFTIYLPPADYVIKVKNQNISFSLRRSYSNLRIYVLENKAEIRNDLVVRLYEDNVLTLRSVSLTLYKNGVKFLEDNFVGIFSREIPVGEYGLKLRYGDKTIDNNIILPYDGAVVDFDYGLFFISGEEGWEEFLNFDVFLLLGVFMAPILGALIISVSLSSLKRRR